jgi:hypothetical protein
MAPPHLENTLLEGCRHDLRRSAPVASRSFPQWSSRAGGILVPYPQEHVAEGPAESFRVVRYTHYLAFRLHRGQHRRPCYQQMWKTLWITLHTRR